MEKAPPPKIILFYPGKAEVTAGESVQLCYGVDNTKAVKIEPLTGPTPPMFNKCIETTPKTTTVYTLVAEGADGATVRQAVTVRVGAARAAAAAGPAGPRLYDLVVTSIKVKAGNPWSLCFKASGAESVSASGGRFAKGANPAGDCLVDTPLKTTTYVITATGAGGATSREKVTVEVEP